MSRGEWRGTGEFTESALREKHRAIQLPATGPALPSPMGYIIAGVVFVIGIVLVMFLLSGRSGGARGRVRPVGAQPVERSQPSAEEANPAASSTIDQGTADRAQRRTPPA
jgi:hypothetical protein